MTGVVLLASALALTAGIVFLSLQYHERLQEYLERGGAGPAMFLALMALLPLAGFPISVFLFLAGVQFGMLRGLGITAAMIALHLPLTYALTHTFMRRPVETLLSRTRYTVPKFQGPHALKIAFIFMAIPGLSYTLKNALLAFSGIPFRHYFILAWSVNLALSIPFIGLGQSVLHRDIAQAVLFGLLILMLFAAVTILKRRRRTH